MQIKLLVVVVIVVVAVVVVNPQGPNLITGINPEMNLPGNPRDVPLGFADPGANSDLNWKCQYFWSYNIPYNSYNKPWAYIC